MLGRMRPPWQPEAYRQEVLPPGVRTLAVEAGVSFGWCEWADAVVGMKSFGASAPARALFEEFGFTAEHVAERARELLSR